MVKNITIWVLLMLPVLTAFGQQPIRVVVADKDSRQPVFLAYVNVYSGTNNALMITEQTDEMGTVTVAPQYPCKIEVVATGYGAFYKEYYSPPVNPEVRVGLVRLSSSLNEVVVTGLNQPEKMKNALAAYKVVPKAIIDAQGAVTLAEVLKNQLNFQSETDGVLGTQVQMQGMAGNKIKILIDGIPLNGREGGNINTAQINMNNVDRVEIIQGPMSVVYGTDAIGGVINIITRKQSKPFGIFINTHVETIGKYNFDGGTTFKVGKKSQLTIGGGRNYFQGNKNIDVPVVYGADTLYYKRSLFFNPNEQYIGNAAYSYKAASGFKLDAATDYLKEKVVDRGNIETWDPFKSTAVDQHYRTTRISNRLSLEGNLGKSGHWQSQNGFVIYDRTRNKINKNMVTMVELPSFGQGDQDTSLFQDVYLRGGYNNKWKKLSYTAGYDVNLQYAQSKKVDSNSMKAIQDYALYANISMPLVESKLTAQVGARASVNSAYKPPIIPNINLLYTPVQRLQIRASYTTGFRAPSLKEMYLTFMDQNHLLVGNENLEAERAQHMQLSASWQAYEEQANYIQLILTGYYNDVTNGIVLVNMEPDNANSIHYKYSNFARQRNVIGSLSGEMQWSNLHAVLGYSANHTFAQAGYYSDFTGSEATLTLQYYFKKAGININYFDKLTGAQPILKEQIDGSIAYSGKQDAYHIADFSADKRFFHKKLQVIVGVKNLFDMQFVSRGGSATPSGGAHSAGPGGGISFLPRSFFTTLKLNID